MAGICLPGDAFSDPFHEPAKHSDALYVFVVSRRSKDCSIRHHTELLQFHEETSDVDDVTESDKVVSMYPRTELLLQKAVDARRRSAMHKSNRLFLNAE